MARTNLGDLLGKVDDPPQPEPPQSPLPAAVQPHEPLHATERPAQQASEVETPAIAATAPKRTAPRAVEPQLAPYLRFVRKETRLSEDQQNQLTLHARRLNRARTGGSSRITDNTLIRVAVDLLLSQIQRANGNDEAEILRSLRK